MERLTNVDGGPFKYINGEQTPESEALEADKGQHQSTPFDLNQFEDALL